MVLAAHLGKSLKECKRDVDSYEFSTWQAWYKIEPFGEHRADYRNAINTCVIANAFRGKGQRAYKPDDFMPKFGDDLNRAKDPKELKDKLFLYARAWNQYLDGGGKIDDGSNKHVDGSANDTDGGLPAGDDSEPRPRLKFL